jgi:hypothetical protein
MEQLRQELQRAYCPAVAVLAHPDVEAACQRNCLSFTELLRPFGVIGQLNGSVGGKERRWRHAAALP